METEWKEEIIGKTAGKEEVGKLMPEGKKYKKEPREKLIDDRREHNVKIGKGTD